MAAATASYPRYPSSASTAPFGGLGGILPTPAAPRPPLTTGGLPSATPHGLPASTPSSYSSYGLPQHPSVREKEEAERRAREERKHKEEIQRDSDLRASREGFPAYVKDRDRNGDTHHSVTNQSVPSDLSTNHRERSPLRLDKERRVSSDTGAVDMSTSQRAPADLSTSQQRTPADLSTGQKQATDLSRPSSVASSVGHVKSASGGEMLKQKEERICDDISIIAEKEGTRSGANSVGVTGGRASVSSDHSIRNGTHAPDHQTLSNGVKSSYYPGHTPTPPRPPVTSYLPPSLAPPAPAHDPRTLAMFPHMMSQSLRPPNPLDPYTSAVQSYAAALDPYRDPFRMDLLGRDPLREARERELMRLGAAAANPLGSLVPGAAELERAKALQLSSAGYPGLGSAAAYPGYPATTPAHHTLNTLYPPAASPALHPSLPGYPHPTSLGYPGINGATLPGQYGAKDPLRR